MVEAYINYDEYIVDVHNPVQLTSDHNFRSVDVTNPLGDLNDRFNFDTNIPFSQSGLKNYFRWLSSVLNITSKTMLVMSVFTRTTERLQFDTFYCHAEYVSGHRWGSTLWYIQCKNGLLCHRRYDFNSFTGTKRDHNFFPTVLHLTSRSPKVFLDRQMVEKYLQDLQVDTQSLDQPTHGQSRFEEGSDFIGNEEPSYTYDVFTPRTDLDGQTITISRIGNDYNVSNNATLPGIQNGKNWP